MLVQALATAAPQVRLAHPSYSSRGDDFESVPVALGAGHFTADGDDGGAIRHLIRHGLRSARLTQHKPNPEAVVESSEAAERLIRWRDQVQSSSTDVVAARATEQSLVGTRGTGAARCVRSPGHTK